LDNKRIHIQCDNIQTIRLVNEEITRLQTKLRHVDIHNHWLRQEVSQGRINVEYTESQNMIADGLTKALPAEQFLRFRGQLGLVDVTERLKEYQANDEKNSDFICSDVASVLSEGVC
jgi:hypothetical protein